MRPDPRHREPVLVEESTRWLAALEAREAELGAAIPTAIPAPCTIGRRYSAPLAPHPAVEPLRRGVYVESYLSVTGYPILLAVASDGRCVARAVVRRDDEWTAVERRLWDVLDAADRAPQLRLVT